MIVLPGEQHPALQLRSPIPGGMQPAQPQRLSLTVVAVTGLDYPDPNSVAK